MIVLFILCILVICSYAFLRFYPPFGGRPTKQAKGKSVNFVKGKFVNQIPTPMDMKLGDMLSLLRDQLRRDPSRKPHRPLTPEPLDMSGVPSHTEPRITWFGHSAFLLELHGKAVLLDPMFGKAASPFPAIGPQRFSKSLPASPEQLPHIDAVVISHDHYDHLDYGSIRKLSSKTSMFFVPLGVAAHLEAWGVQPERITELDWWEERTFEGICFACTPARHFSGRSLTDRFATLWSSWVIKSDEATVFFSGDTGYGPHFSQIGETYGPFDLTLLECGQYDRRWSNIHMTPEQTLTAHQDLRGTRMIPMHWGAFVLALHGWTEPVQRVLAAGAKVDATIVTPKIGEVVAFQASTYPTEAWWEPYKS